MHLNIANYFRISNMVEKLCTFYGKEICEHDGVKYFSFPEVEKLAESQVWFSLIVNTFE